MTLPLPMFYDPKAIPTLFVERADLVADEAEAYARRHGVAPSAEDTTKVAAFGIDAQVAFCMPGASLFVPGAVDDTQRAIEFLYKNLARVTTLFFSMDTHHVFQVFHPSFWVDETGAHPAPFTPISASDVRAGKWRSITHAAESLEYVERLESAGRYTLTIWPYHALLGGISHALVPALMELAIFHAAARRQSTRFETKGLHPLTESYSVLSPEVVELGGERVGSFNAALFDALTAHDRVYVFGQAKSHCVLSTLTDIQAHAERTDPALLHKIWILEDAMSPVPPPSIDPLPAALDFPALAERAFDRLRRAGMHVVKTTDPILL